MKPCPKDVICIVDGFIDLSTGKLHENSPIVPQKDKIYRALSVIDEPLFEKSYYLLEEFSSFGGEYETNCFRDLDEVEIKEIEEIIKEQPITL